MKIYTLVALLIVIVLTLDAISGCEGWFGGSRSRSRSRSSSSRSVSRSRTSTRRTGSRWGSRTRSSSRSTSRTVSRSKPSSTRRSNKKSGSTSRKGGFWGSGRRTTGHNSRYNRPKPMSVPKVSVKKTDRGTTVKVGSKTVHTRDFLKIRDRDETGHRTGLGTLGRKIISQPGKTIDAIKSFAKSYNDMRKKNVIGGNLDAHRKGNKDATLKSDAQTAGAISALREQYKNFRVKQNKDGSIHIGDTRTKKERDSTMNANKQGRQDAKNSKKP